LQVSLLDATVLDFTGGLFSVALSVSRSLPAYGRLSPQLP